MSLKHSVVATGVNDPSKQVSKDAWNNDHVIFDGLVFPAETVTNPPVDTVKHFAAKMAGKMMPTVQLNKAEESFEIQQSFGGGRVLFVLPNIAASNTSNVGITFGAFTGTSTTATFSYSSKYQSFARQDVLQSTPSTTNVAGWRYAANAWSRTGSISGFYVTMRSGVATGASNASSRFYIGMRNSTAAPTDINPSTQVQHVGFGWDSADANAQIMVNGAGSTVKIDLGSSWAVPVTDRSELYELQIYAPRASTSIFVQVTELVSGKTFTTELTTNLPDLALAPIMYTGVGGVSDVTGLTFGLFYSELFA